MVHAHVSCFLLVEMSFFVSRGRPKSKGLPTTLEEILGLSFAGVNLVGIEYRQTLASTIHLYQQEANYILEKYHIHQWAKGTACFE